MTLHINGEQRDFPDNLTVAGLVAQLGMKPDRVAVELNLEIVPRTQWETTTLKTGDKLEVVHFVGGGSGGRSEMRADPLDSNESPAKAQWLCPTCGNLVIGRFCPSCGEKKSSAADLSMRHFFSHALGELFHFDSKIFGSFRLLFTRPGFLTAEYARGCRKPYLHPFQVFFIANLIYFFLQPLTGWSGLKTPLYVHTHMLGYNSLATRLVAQRVAAKRISESEFTHAFDHVVDLQARSLVLLMVPMFALALALLEWRKNRVFGEHLAFALHFYAFWVITLFLVVFGLSKPVLLFLQHRGIVFIETSLDRFLYLTGQALIFIYLVPALRTFYHDKIGFAVAKALALIVAMNYMMQAYRFILFLTALYSA
ncbi:MAG: sulfur carrier protein ThiS [Candidatus Angelobacter sp.]